MKVVLASHLGMCFGVRDALETTRHIHQPHQVTIYGQLVHNPQINRDIAQRGFLMLPEDARPAMPATPHVLITAHGLSQKERQRLQRAGKSLIDTTCPLVRRVHQAAMRLQDEGCFVLVIGKRNHVEVQGIIGDLHAYDVVENPAEVKIYEAPRLGIVCQSTTPPFLAEQIHQEVAARNPGKSIEFIDTICQPTRARQEAVLELLERVDALVVVGGRHSNNTRQLARLAETHGVPSLQVETPADLDPALFAPFRVVGLTAGTSTPDSAIQAVYEKLLSLGKSPPDNVPTELPERRAASLPSLEGPKRARPVTSEEWLEYFSTNRRNLLPIPWESSYRLTAEESKTITNSIRIFQLGENSEGRHFLQAARDYAARSGDLVYIDALKFFIAEEQRHARDLGRFMDSQGIPRAKIHWTDFIFRKLRRLLDLEMSIAVLITPELIAKIYYKALHESTQSPVLRKICRQILRDEVEHIYFQAGTLGKIRRSRRNWTITLLEQSHRLFFLATLAVVWLGHHNILQAGGYGLRRFFTDGLKELSLAFEISRSLSSDAVSPVNPQSRVTASLSSARLSSSRTRLVKS